MDDRTKHTARGILPRASQPWFSAVAHRRLGHPTAPEAPAKANEPIRITSRRAAVSTAPTFGDWLERALLVSVALYPPAMLVTGLWLGR